MRRTLVSLILVIILVACDDTIVKSGYHTIVGGSWNRDSIVEFTFSDLDTLQKQDIFINVRNDNDFPYNNLFLIAELDIPTGETLTDTLEYEMASPDGHWLGNGAGSIKENKLWYKENIVFPVSGVYTIRLSHAMRKNGHVEGISNLDGITDVGYEIVKSNK
ncbi:MAG: gliding motility lipoprotein GldH [Maribacter sp.]|nr:gliding motility lipoprotein GldH [Maribacter sp.]